MSVNNEIRDAVYRQLPTTIRNLIKNQCPHGDDDFSDNWITICDALAKSIHLAESAAPAVQAFTLKTNFTPRPILSRPFPAPRIASVETSKGQRLHRARAMPIMPREGQERSQERSCRYHVQQGAPRGRRKHCISPEQTFPWREEMIPIHVVRFAR